MCSILENGIEEMEECVSQETEKKLLGAPCIRCRGKSELVLRKQVTYCQQCFLASTTHKFRFLLGKTYYFKKEKPVLIVYDGGPAATTLLHLVHYGVNSSIHKKLRVDPVVLFINDINDVTTADVLSTMESFKFSCFSSSLVTFIENTDTKPICYKLNVNTISEKVLESVNDYLKSKLPNLTARNNLLEIHKRNLIIAVSKELKCPYVFLPEMLVDIGVNILTDICAGRGLQIAVNEGVCDTRDPEVTIIRPMRYIDTSEINYYNTYNNLKPLNDVQEDSKSQYRSVQNLMRSFVNNLQINFPATAATIVKTGDKLASDTSMNVSSKCNLCEGPKESSSSELSSRTATEFSRFLSTGSHVGVNGLNFVTDCSEELCFACRKITEKYKMND